MLKILDADPTAEMEALRLISDWEKAREDERTRALQS